MTFLTALMLIAQATGQAAPPAPTVAQAAAEKPVLPQSISSYFAGRWNGEGRFVRSGKALQSTFEFEPRLGGEGMIVHHVEKQPATFAYDAILSVDSLSGELVMLMASNHKGGARLFRSAGWNGDTLVFQSVPELRSSFALERITFVREAATRFKATYEMSMDKGATWRAGDEQVFTKA